MISICCCALNSKWDTEMFIRALLKHNQGVEFEIVLAHDDRVEDGSAEHFKNLEIEIPNLKVVTRTFKDTTDYLDRLMVHYDTKNIFEEEFRNGLKENVEKFKNGTLYDISRSFLWMSSGLLYNLAVEASSGDTLIITPGDFLYLFSLKELEEYVKIWGDNYYCSPHAIFARVTNQEKDWLLEHMQEVKDGKGGSNYSNDSVHCVRDYLRYPSALCDVYIPNFISSQLISLDDENFLDKSKDFCQQHVEGLLSSKIQFIPNFHGFHIMSRTVFNATEGFTEEFCGRAFADDKMTTLGKRHGHPKTLPAHFSVAWCGQGELVPYRGKHYSAGWRDILKEIDIYYDKHPIPGEYHPTYLHQDLVSGTEMADKASRFFNKTRPSVRI